MGSWLQIVIFGILITYLTGCSNFLKSKSTSEYPKHWWQEVPKAELASWEISPNSFKEADNTVVLSKRNELGRFSNLSPDSFVLDGVEYASVEALWQSLKYPESAQDERYSQNVNWKLTRKEVQNLSGFEAKRAGDAANEIMKKLNIKWVSYNGKKIFYTGEDQQIHFELIKRAIKAKLESNPDLKNLLIKTANLNLVPDHKIKEDAPPAYKYHHIYMSFRSEYLSK